MRYTRLEGSQSLSRENTFFARDVFRIILLLACVTVISGNHRGPFRIQNISIARHKSLYFALSFGRSASHSSFGYPNGRKTDFKVDLNPFFLFSLGSARNLCQYPLCS